VNIATGCRFVVPFSFAKIIYGEFEKVALYLRIITVKSLQRGTGESETRGIRCIFLGQLQA
jgi:hypothetical protein